MAYEVELKFPLSDPARLRAKLDAVGASPPREEVHRDLYFAHPARSFPDTDEALRLRHVGETNRITYKGPKIDAASKTRIEVEARLADGVETAAAMAEVLQRLGFRPVAEVRKLRQERSLSYRGRDVVVTADDVEQVGSFAELETIAEEGDVTAARQVLEALAQELGLEGSIRTSYLEMLLEKKSSA
jgi:adenylate cyclase class 2